MAGVTRADLVGAVDEVVTALAQFSERDGREVELVLQANGTVELMAADAQGGSFERIASFDAFEHLWMFLQMAGVA